MSGAGDTNSSTQLTRAVARVLGEGLLAALVTVVEAPRGVGAKVLIEAGGARTGTTGDDALNDALAKQADAFLSSRAETATSCTAGPYAIAAVYEITD